MSKKWIWIGVAILIVVGAGGYFGYQQLTETVDEPTAVSPDAIGIETDRDVVNAEGRVVPAQQTLLSYLDGGAVTAVLVAEGAAVNAGDPLIQLETIDQEIGIRQAQTAVSLAEANLAYAEAGLQLAQIGLDGARLAVRDAEADLALLQAGASAEQIALSESNLAIAEAGIVQASGSRAAALENASAAEIAAAQAQLTFAQTEYDNALKTYQPILQDEESDDDDREQAALRLNAAQAALTAAQTALNTLQAGATGAEYTAAESGVTVAANQRDAAQAQLDLLLAGTRQEQIAVAEAIIAGAETAVSEAEGQVASAETAVLQAQAALLEAQTSLAAAENDLEKRTLRAPFDGAIAAVNVKEGETAQAGAPIVALADFSRWQIETTDLTELDVVAIAAGLPVAVQIDAFPAAALRGEVADIAATAVEIRGEATYAVTIDLLETNDLPLRWGMTAFVNVLTDPDAALPAADPIAPPAPRIEAEGELVPQFFINLAFDAGGRVAAIPVSEEDFVQPDDALIVLETDGLELALAQAEAGAATAQAGAMAAQNQMALAETAVAQAENNLLIAQANLTLTKAGALPAEIAAAEAALAAAETAVTQAQAGRTIALDTVSDADIANAEANLIVAEADLRAIEDKYQEILDACFDTPDGQTICPLYGAVEEQTRGQLQAAQANYAAAQAFLDMLRAGPTAAQEAAAGGAVALAVANREAAQARLDLLLADTSPEALEKAHIGVEQAELGVDLAVARFNQTETAVAQAEAAVAAAEAGRDAVQATLERMTLRAPMEGVVTDLAINPGEMAIPGAPVAALADLSSWLVKTTDVSELDVPYIEVGSAAEIRFEAIPDRTLTGTVTKIAPMPGAAQGNVVYQVTIQLDKTDELPLRWGMTAVVVFDP